MKSDTSLKSRVLTGNEAAAFACRDAGVQVVAAYPITPQSPVTERIAQFVESGEMDAEYVCVESEHSAITVCISASSVGARVFTATSANGLCLMHEQLHWAAGARLPLVMACVNRGVGAPWTIWTDQQDSISQRDTGWLQLYVEDNQEIYDTLLQAFRIAELCHVPVMVCYDGYILSHTAMPVKLTHSELVSAFLPPRSPAFQLDPKDPRNFNLVTLPEPRRDHEGIYKKGAYMELRYRLHVELRKAEAVVNSIQDEYADLVGREYGGSLKTYETDDADVVILAMGTLASEARVAVDQLREDGVPAGLVSLRLYRPFPGDALAQAIGEAAHVIVFDRNVSYGHEGALASDLKSHLFSTSLRPKVSSLIVGLGGRDVTVEALVSGVRQCLERTEPVVGGWLGILGGFEIQESG